MKQTLEVPNQYKKGLFHNRSGGRESPKRCSAKSNFLSNLKKKGDLYLFLGVFILLLLSVTIYPFIYTLYLSFHKWIIIQNPEKNFIGLGNFAKLFQNEYFLNSSVITFIFVFTAVGLETLIGLVLAVLFDRKIRGYSIIRTIVIMPVLLTPIGIGYLFIPILTPDFGILNYLLSIIGFPGNIAWTANPSTVLLSCILVDVWQWTPFMFLVLFTGLQSLPQQVYQAAKVDGASRWQIFIYITMPLILPVLGVALTLRVMDAFKIFDIIYVLTFGGPGNLTDVLTLFIYRKSFTFWNFGEAAASSILMLIFSIACIIILIKFTQRRT